MSINLPNINTDDTKQFFDKFFTHEVTFPAGEIDATIGFFLRKGFDQESARSISIVILNQARLDNVSTFKLLDTLKVLTDIQLSQLVTQVLNAYREKTSILGYRINSTAESYESRNILV